jgi:hypothetical protein
MYPNLQFYLLLYVGIKLGLSLSRNSTYSGCWRKKKTIILPSILYGCETCSVTLREEHRLKVYENRVLRRIFGLKREEVAG